MAPIEIMERKALLHRQAVGILAAEISERTGPLFQSIWRWGGYSTLALVRPSIKQALMWAYCNGLLSTKITQRLHDALSLRNL